jgi:cold shock CspA family protein
MSTFQHQGEVKNWNERGFFFVRPDDGGPDLFGHASSLQDGLMSVKAGTRVWFDIEMSDRGPRCKNVRVIPALSDFNRRDFD